MAWDLDITPEGTDGLSIGELAVAGASTPSEIDDLVRRGLLRGPTAAGRFDRGDVSRLRLIGSLLRSGVGLEQLTAAVAAGRLSFSFAGDLIVDPPGLTAEDHGHALAAVGLDETFARRMQLALGLPQSLPDRMIREDDRELYGLAAAARREGVSDEAILRVLRATTVAMRSIVAAQRDLFRQSIEEPMLAAGLSHREMLDAGAPLRLRLQRMGHRVVFLLLRRMLEEVIFENVVLRLEEALAEAGIPRVRGDAETTIAFADLSEFTRLTIERGDEAAAEQGARFVALVQDVATPFGGRLVKPLGDGVMLHFPLPRDAVDCLAVLIEGAEAAALPAIRAGVAMGPVVSRDGDFFGHTVNLAARLVNAAGPNEIWATSDVAVAAQETRVTFAEGTEKTLKGIEHAIEVRVARIAGG
jgi:adenylate cyclase